MPITIDGIRILLMKLPWRLLKIFDKDTVLLCYTPASQQAAKAEHYPLF